MRIVVCVKQISHTYARTGMDPSRDYIAPEDQVILTNPCDEAAMETAVRLKEENAGSQVIVVTLGPLLSEKELRRLAAFGADECVHIECNGELDPWAKSVLLSRVLRSLEGDLVLCGRESLDRGNGQVGPFCARRLDMPFLGPLLEASVDLERQKVRGVKKGRRGVRQVLECPLPAVIGMDLGGLEIRFPSYEARVRAENVPVLKIEGGPVEAGPGTERKRVFPPKPRAGAVPAPDPRLSAEERIDFLLSGSRVEKKGEILTGDADALAAEVAAYLEKEGFIP